MFVLLFSDIPMGHRVRIPNGNIKISCSVYHRRFIFLELNYSSMADIAIISGVMGSSLCQTPVAR